QRCRHLYLYRSPEDALVSLYHHVLRENFPGAWTKARRRPEINDFCRKALPGWFEHLSGYLAAAEEGVPVRFASYERLLAEPASVLGETLHWMGVPHSDSMLKRADLNMQFQK